MTLRGVTLTTYTSCNEWHYVAWRSRLTQAVTNDITWRDVNDLHKLYIANGITWRDVHDLHKLYIANGITWRDVHDLHYVAWR